MSSQYTELDAWLAGEDLFSSANDVLDDWVAGFDADRQLVAVKLGPFQRLFLRPAKFVKRFYHQLYPLAIQTWSYRKEIKLFEEFCTIEITLDLRFQATLAYVQKNFEALEYINQHIQQLYEPIVSDIVNQELAGLADGVWVKNGLQRHEKRIALAVCELLTQQQIQAEAICRMQATFAEFPDVQLGRDSVFLQVLRKTFEVNQQKNAELERQQRIAEEQALRAKQQELEHVKQLAELQRQIQLQEAEAQLKLLQDKEVQSAKQRELEQRLHAQQIEHEQFLKKTSQEAELTTRQDLENRQRSIEAQLLAEQLSHQAMMQDRQTSAEIERIQAAQRKKREANLKEIDHENFTENRYP